MSNAITTQNWPDPKRPGVPMFPERDGWHALEDDERKEYWWDAHCSCWTTSEDGEFSWIPDDMSSVLGFSYIGPVLTPTQINEMLAAERERCLAACESAKVATDGWGDPIDDGDADRNEGIVDAMAAIARLGAAP